MIPMGDTADHLLARLDPRAKLGMLILLSLASSQAQATGLGLLALATLPALAATTPAVRQALRRMLLAALPLLLLALLARAVSMPGTSVMELSGIHLTREGLMDGLRVASRLALVTIWGLLFALTTQAEALRAALYRLLRTVPWLPAARIATLFGLSLRLLPLILTAAQATRDAQWARGGGSRNPLRRTLQLALPLLHRLFRQADLLALAMEARLYNDQRTEPELQAAPRDGWAIAATAFLAALTFWIEWQSKAL